MATKLGSSTHQSDIAEWYGAANQNQFARKLTFPAGGPWLVESIGAWFTGKDTAATYQLCVWNFSTGALLGHSASANANNEAFALGASNSHEADVTTPFEVAGGTSVLVGYSRDRDEAMQHDMQNGVTGYYNEKASWPGSMSGYSTETEAIQAWLYYTLANSLPDAPTLTSPASGNVEVTATPTFVFTHNDDDGDACASYDIQVDNNSDFSSPLWDLSNGTSGIVGTTVTRVYGGSALSRGTTYYWRARTADAVGDGAWSASRTFIYNALPTATKNAPATSGFAVIHNLTDLVVWSASEAKPQFKFTPSDTLGGSLSKYRIIIYDASAGGSTIWDSGEVALAMTSGVLVTINGTTGLANGTEYWWTINVYDGYEWAGESSRTAFKLRWAQGIFERDLTAAGTANWAMATGTTTETVALMYGSSSGAARTGSTDGWDAAVSTLTTYRYLQVLVRLTTDTPGTQGSLADMTFSYYGVPSQPDGWTAS